MSKEKMLSLSGTKTLLSDLKKLFATKDVCTTSTKGLMDPAMLSKLNGIATGANKYVHPTTAGNKHIPSGGAKGNFLVWSASGTAVWDDDNAVQLTKENLDTLLTPGKYFGAGSNTVLGKPKGIDYFGLEIYKIASGYIAQRLHGSDNIYYHRYYNNIEKKFTTDWIDGYDSIHKPTVDEIGAAAKTHNHGVASSTANGFMPKLDASTSHYMRGDGKWVTPPNTTYKQFTGATSSANGTSGLVPAPVKGAASKFLKSDGTWSDVPKSTVNKSEIVNMIYPVGSLYMSTSSANPSTLFGGTWEAFGQGRTLIGKTDEGTFSELESVGGAESKSISIAAHSHTIAHTHTIGNHTHTLNNHTHTVNSHTHTLSSHTHNYSHNHSIGNTVLSLTQLTKHNHAASDSGGGNYGAYQSNTSGGGLWHVVTRGWAPNQGSLQMTTTSTGGSGSHNHSISPVNANTGAPSNNNTSASSPGTGTPSNNSTSSAGSTTTSAASSGSSGSAGAQTISVNILQPYIIVNIWKRTA